MNNLLKYLGVILLIIGVIILALPTFTGRGTSNLILLIGLSAILIGYVAHIILNKKVE
jgi:uncharacterized membrane protein HdeD (DUF308 family)